MPEIELSDEAKDAIGHLNGKNVEEAREIGRDTKAPPFDPGKASLRAKRKPAPPAFERVEFCKECGKRVPAGREGYCSNACEENAAPPPAPASSSVSCKNPECGKPVHQVRTHGGRKREYCSDSCRMNVKNAAQKARARPAEPADLDMTPTLPSPPAPTMPEQKVISLNVGISLTMDQIQTLNPGQIAALFEGLAMVLGAGK